MLYQVLTINHLTLSVSVLRVKLARHTWRWARKFARRSFTIRTQQQLLLYIYTECRWWCSSNAHTIKLKGFLVLSLAVAHVMQFLSFFPHPPQRALLLVVVSGLPAPPGLSWARTAATVYYVGNIVIYVRRVSIISVHGGGPSKTDRRRRRRR